LKQPAHLARSPFGQIPTLENGDLVLFESGAIVLHIAQRHPGLLPVRGSGLLDAHPNLIAYVAPRRNAPSPRNAPYSKPPRSPVRKIGLRIAPNKTAVKVGLPPWPLLHLWQYQSALYSDSLWPRKTDGAMPKDDATWKYTSNNRRIKAIIFRGESSGQSRLVG
jgi:Glutathione S-transferase